MRDAREWELEKDDVLEAFQQLAADMLEAFRLPRAHARTYPPSMQWTAYFSRQSSEPVEDTNLDLDPSDLAGVHRIFVMHSMQHHLSNFLEKFRAESEHVGLDYFPSIVIPYLRGVAESLESEVIPMSENYRVMFTQILHQYLQRFVQQQPTKPVNWTKRTQGCGCHHCNELDSFLISPTQKQKRIKANESVRKHIDGKVPTYPEPSRFATTTEKGAIPYTLVITKSHKVYEKAQRDWSKCAAYAKEQMATIASEEQVRALLGESYEAIKTLRCVSLSPLSIVSTTPPGSPGNSRTPLGPLSNINDRAAASNLAGKRKLSADLDEDGSNAKKSRVAIVDLCNTP